MTLRDYIRRLSREQLLTIIRTRQLYFREPPDRVTDRERLAALVYPRLAQDPAVRAALAQTTIEERALLQRMVANQGHAPLDDLLRTFFHGDRRAAGLAVKRLVDLGFIWEETGSLYLPDVYHRYLRPAPTLGQTYVHLLGFYQDDHLKRLSAEAGVPLTPWKREAAIQQLARRLADPEEFRARWDRLPLRLQTVLTELVVAPLSVPALLQGPTQEFARSCAALERAGLLFRRPGAGWPTSGVGLPEEAAQWIRAEFRPIPTAPGAAMESFLLAEAPEVRRVRSREGRLPCDLLVILAGVIQGEMELTQQGAIRQRFLKKVAATLGTPTDYVELLTGLVLAGGLVQGPGPRLQLVPGRAEAWWRTPDDAARCALQAWCATPTWDEGLGPSGTLSWSYREALGLASTLRQKILSLLALLPAGRWVGLARFEAVLFARYPFLLQPTQPQDRWAPSGPLPFPAEAVQKSLLGSLHYLGVVAVADPLREPLFQVTPWGARLLTALSSSDASSQESSGHAGSARAPASAAPPGRATTASQESQDSSTSPPGGTARPLVVLPNYELVFPLEVPFPVFARACAFTEVVRIDRAVILRLTQASLRRALDQGLTMSGIRGLLNADARDPLPDTVTHLLDQVDAKYGEVVVGYAGAYLEVKDPSTLQGLLAQRKFAKYFAKAIGDRAAVLHPGVPVERVLGELKKAGYMAVGPVGTKEVVPPWETGAGRGTWAPAPRAYPPPVRLTEAPPPEVLPLVPVQGLTPSGEEPAPPGAGRVLEEASDPSRIRHLLDQAIEEGRWVLLHYTKNSGETSKRLVEPYGIEGQKLFAYCHLSQDDRIFRLGNIRLAWLLTEAPEAP